MLDLGVETQPEAVDPVGDTDAAHSMSEAGRSPPCVRRRQDKGDLPSVCDLGQFHGVDSLPRIRSTVREVDSFSAERVALTSRTRRVGPSEAISRSPVCPKHTPCVRAFGAPGEMPAEWHRGSSDVVGEVLVGSPPSNGKGGEELVQAVPVEAAAATGGSGEFDERLSSGGHPPGRTARRRIDPDRVAQHAGDDLGRPVAAAVESPLQWFRPIVVPGRLAGGRVLGEPLDEQIALLGPDLNRRAELELGSVGELAGVDEPDNGAAFPSAASSLSRLLQLLALRGHHEVFDVRDREEAGDADDDPIIEDSVGMDFLQGEVESHVGQPDRGRGHHRRERSGDQDDPRSA